MTSSCVATITRFGSSGTLHAGQLPLPSQSQQRRIFELLTHLSQHHTKQCTRNTHPLYKAQARKQYEYEILLGCSTPAQAKSWFKYWHPTDELGTAPGIYDDDVAPRRRLVPTEVGRCKGRNHKYFFAINLYNSFSIILGLFASMLHVDTILGYENVFISVYENRSNNKTKSLLKISSALTQSVGMHIIIHTNHWCKDLVRPTPLKGRVFVFIYLYFSFY